MKKSKGSQRKAATEAPPLPSAIPPNTGNPSTGKIHPVVIYPFHQPDSFSDLEHLYSLVAWLGGDKQTYSRPITVIDRKTHYSNEGNPRFRDFRESVVAKHSDIVDAWCVDTCQMWYTGLGQAMERGEPADVYWLIPGDFNYGTQIGQEVLDRLHDLPEICLECQQDICIGEIVTDHNNSKQCIDTYGTFALLYTWFPLEAQEIRQSTERPRSEFFAVRHDFLGEALRRRWFAYEQTMVMLLQAVAAKKRISRFSVGDISDVPEGREPLASAIQQIERTERVLKTVWREQHQSEDGWLEQYSGLERKSEQVRHSAYSILGNLLS